MGFYVVQREEKEIDFELFEQLADALSRETGIPKLDAKMQMKHFYGMLNVTDEERAQKISESFKKTGLDNFILREEQLIQLPRHKQLGKDYLDSMKLTELIAVGEISREIEEKSWRVNLLRMKFIGPRIPVLGSSIEENVRRKRQTVYYLDFFTRQTHWRITRDSLPKREMAFLKDIGLSKTYLTQSVKRNLEGNERVISFSSEIDYNKYLTWLFQLRYAKR